MPEQIATRRTLSAGAMVVDFGDHMLESRALGEVGQRRDRELVAQQRFRLEHDQRLAEITMQLAAQRVEVVRRRGQVADVHIAFGTELQIALDARRGVFRALALVAVRQQQHQTGHAQPLGFPACQELVDDDLCAVGEVAELRLPQHQGAGVREGIAVFEAEYPGFRQQRVVDLDLCLVRRDVVQRGVFVLVELVDQHRVALAERATLGVLAGQPDATAFQQQAAERQRLTGRPVDALAGIDRLRLGFQLAGDLRVEVEARPAHATGQRRSASACRTGPRSAPRSARLPADRPG